VVGDGLEPLQKVETGMEAATMMHVLVIDGEPVLRAAWKYLLEERGYAVHLASNGAEGVELCRETEPDLAILDVEAMPGIGDWLAEIEMVRTELPDVQILVLSPWSLDRERALDCGATVCVSKPVDYATVLRLADMMVDSGRWSVAGSGIGAGAGGKMVAGGR
jgi:twitching motility two-component system response regulator PilH